ncbi:hypothetical protein ColTof4_12605 [Colletotrichum tofieldiae]|nr:hypothetical protein ColTof3_06442 [Colletotrichum tofieldiae]GKT80182.1 hypothetical protein ColTof4_12605 [Colletotrichum tofieldiae]GKT85253.1 hypothetical protein Ct61P_03103 [Colletotrichum tofieldiae]
MAEERTSLSPWSSTAPDQNPDGPGPGSSSTGTRTSSTRPDPDETRSKTIRLSVGFWRVLTSRTAAPDAGQDSEGNARWRRGLDDDRAEHAVTYAELRVERRAPV